MTIAHHNLHLCADALDLTVDHQTLQPISTVTVVAGAPGHTALPLTLHLLTVAVHKQPLPAREPYLGAAVVHGTSNPAVLASNREPINNLLQTEPTIIWCFLENTFLRSNGKVCQHSAVSSEMHILGLLFHQNQHYMFSKLFDLIWHLVFGLKIELDFCKMHIFTQFTDKTISLDNDGCLNVISSYIREQSDRTRKSNFQNWLDGTTGRRGFNFNIKKGTAIKEQSIRFKTLMKIIFDQIQFQHRRTCRIKTRQRNIPKTENCVISVMVRVLGIIEDWPSCCC